MLDKKWVILGILITSLVVALNQTKTGRAALQGLYSVVCEDKTPLCPSGIGLIDGIGGPRKPRKPPFKFRLKE